MCGECEQTLGEASATNNAQEARENHANERKMNQ
jgi:hypothetical protein